MAGLMDKATNFLALGASGLIPMASKPGRSNFSDSGMTTGLVILILVLILLEVLLLVAVYRLTDGSWANVILCLFFGSIYMFIALIYYGFTGHKFVKVK